jgi:hypothetical protein
MVYLSSNIASTSTATPNGSWATPTAERECCPASLKTLLNTSEAPLATAGCSVKSGSLLTKYRYFYTTFDSL